MSGADTPTQDVLCPCGAVLPHVMEPCPACGHSSRDLSRCRPTWERMVLLASALAIVVGALLVILPRASESMKVRRSLDAAAKDIAEGRPQDALQPLERMAAERPRDTEAWRLLALVRLRRNDLDGALAAAEQARSVAPDSASLAALVAQVRLARREARAALGVVRDVAGAEARIAEACAFAALGRPEAASAALARVPVESIGDLETAAAATALELDLAATQSPGAARHAARAATLAQRVAAIAESPESSSDEATAAFASAVAAEATSPETEVVRRYVHAVPLERSGAAARTRWIRWLARHGRLDEARACLEGLDDARLAVAATALAQAGDADGAARVLATACGRAPDCATLRVALIRALLAAGRPPEAVAAARVTPQDRTADADLLAAAGDAMLASGDPVHAAAFHDAALARRPDDARLVLRRHASSLESLVGALALGRDPRPEEAQAREALDRLHATDEDDPDVLGWSSRLAAAEGRTGSALNLARRRLELAPEDPDARRVAYCLACAAASDEEIERLAASVCPSETTPAEDYATFAAAALEHGRISVAVRVAGAGIVHHRSDAHLALLAAQALLASGDARGAEQRIAESCGCAPSEPRGRELAGLARALSGRLDAVTTTFPDTGAPTEIAAKARVLAASGSLQLAENTLRGGLVSVGREPVLVRGLAAVLLARGNTAEAIELLEPLARGEAAEPGDVTLLAEAKVLCGSDADLAESLRGLRERAARLTRSDAEVLRLDAQIAAASGDLQLARTRIQRYLAMRPSDTRAWCDGARIAQGLGRADDAAGDLRRAQVLAPAVASARREVAGVVYAEAAGRATERKATDDTMKPESTSALRALAVELYQKRLADKCEAQCRKVLDQDPKDEDTKILMALARRSRGDLEGAIADLGRLVTRRGDDPRLRIARGLLLLQAGREDAAVQDFDAAETAGAKGADLEYGRTGCAVLAHHADEALQHARRAVELAPGEPFAHRAMGEALVLEHDVDGAVAAWNTAHERSPTDPSSVIAAARLLLREGRTDDAATELDLLGRESDDALLLRAEAALAAQSLEQAEAALERVKSPPASAWLGVATLAERLDDPVRALRAYRAAVTAGLRTRDLRLHMGALASRTGRTDEARAIFEDLLAQNADDAAAANDLALLLASAAAERTVPTETGTARRRPGSPKTASGESDGASRRQSALVRPLDLARRARKLLPKDPDVADTLGYVLFLNGDGAAARPLLEEAIRTGDRADARYHLGLLETDEHHGEAARTNLERALKDSPRAPWAPRARELLAGR